MSFIAQIALPAQDVGRLLQVGRTLSVKMGAPVGANENTYHSLDSCFQWCCLLPRRDFVSVDYGGCDCTNAWCSFLFLSKRWSTLPKKHARLKSHSRWPAPRFGFGRLESRKNGTRILVLCGPTCRTRIFERFVVSIRSMASVLFDACPLFEGRANKWCIPWLLWQQA